MPTKAKDNRPGFFERTGKKLDSIVIWVKDRISSINSIYRSLNGKYTKKIHDLKILRILPSSLLLLALFIVVIPFLAARITDGNRTIYDSQVGAVIFAADPFYDGEITQDFSSRPDTIISSVGVLIGTHQRSNHAEYLFSLKKNDDVIYSETFSAKSIPDNEYYHFFFDPVQIEDENEYSFSIKALNTSENNAISLYRNRESNDIIYSLGNKSPFRTYAIITSVIFLVFFCIINALINSGKIKTEFHFLAYMLVYIIPLVFIFPASAVPDEPYHFLGALRLSQYDLSDSLEQNLSRKELNLPTNSGCLTAYYLDNGGRIDESKFAECFSSAPSAEGRYIGADNTNRILAYIPAALGIKFGDLISDSPMVIFYFGRIFNLIVVAIIVVYAISLIKKHRMVLLAIVMIPMFLQQAVSYSYDGLLNSLCLLIIAYGIRFLITDAKVRKRDVVIIALSLAFIGLIKVPYIALALPLVFVKTEKFGKYQWAKWLILIILLIVSVTPYLVDSCIVPPDPDSVTSRGRGLPLSSLLASPYTSIKMFLRTLYTLGEFYLTSMIGYFSWFYFALDPIVVLSYLVFLVVVTLSTSEVKFSKFLRFAIILASLAIIGSTFLAMYLSHTTAGALVIEGVQGRYFIPVIPFLMLAFIPKKKYVNLQNTVCYAFMNLILLCFVVTLLMGFY